MTQSVGVFYLNDSISLYYLNLKMTQSTCAIYLKMTQSTFNFLSYIPCLNQVSSSHCDIVNICHQRWHQDDFNNVCHLHKSSEFWREKHQMQLKSTFIELFYNDSYLESSFRISLTVPIVLIQLCCLYPVVASSNYNSPECAVWSIIQSRA